MQDDWLSLQFEPEKKKAAVCAASIYQTGVA
jgi:hypothetical protein